MDPSSQEERTTEGTERVSERGHHEGGGACARVVAIRAAAAPPIRLTVSTLSLLMNANAGLDVVYCGVEQDPRARDLTVNVDLQLAFPIE
jgi:hypothetical protein